MAKIHPMRPEEKEAERIFEMAMKQWQDTGLSPNSKQTVPSLYERIDLLEDPLLQKRIEHLRDCHQKENTFAYDHYDNQTWVMRRKKKVCLKYYLQAVKCLKPCIEEAILTQSTFWPILWSEMVDTILLEDRLWRHRPCGFWIN